MEYSLYRLISISNGVDRINILKILFICSISPSPHIKISGIAGQKPYHFVRDVINVVVSPSKAINKKETRKLLASAINPITGGPNKNPK